MNDEDFEKLKKENIEKINTNERLTFVQLLMPFTDACKELLEINRDLGKKQILSSLAAIIIHSTKDIDEAMEIVNEIKKIIITCDKDINK